MNSPLKRREYRDFFTLNVSFEAERVRMNVNANQIYHVRLPQTSTPVYRRALSEWAEENCSKALSAPQGTIVQIEEHFPVRMFFF